MPYKHEISESGKAVYLASGDYSLGSLTLDASLFTADANGKIELKPGLLLAKPSASELWGPYDSTANDGRQTATNNVVVLHDWVDLKVDGETDNATVAYLIEGTAKADKVHLEDGTPISNTLKDALRSRICDVIFALG